MTRRDGLHVLIADAFDEREMYAEALRASGVRVTTAATVEDALARIRLEQFHVVVQGLVFADGDAIHLVKHLKATIPRTPIIVLSGFTDERHLSPIRHAGADSIVLKPCLPNDLLNEVFRVLELVGN